MIIAQSAATSRIFAQRYHERVDADADILGLSAANGERIKRDTIPKPPLAASKESRLT
jgi:hypothetical protein